MDELRALAQGLLPPGAALRTSRGWGIYATTALEAAPALAAAGFAPRQAGRALLIGLGPALLPWLDQRLPPAGDSLGRGLNALAGRSTGPQELALLEEALRMGEKGGLRRPDFEKRLRQQAALCLRLGAGGGALELAWRAARQSLGQPPSHSS